LAGLCDELLHATTLEKRPDKQSRHCWSTDVKRAVFYQGDNYAPNDGIMNSLGGIAKER
jgi:hypothetical protein